MKRTKIRLLAAIALFFSLPARADDQRSEFVFKGYKIVGSSENVTYVITRNPNAALWVGGSGQGAVAHISSGRLMCYRYPSSKAMEFRKVAVEQNAIYTQVTQEIALGRRLTERQEKSYQFMKLMIQFVNEAGDADYYDCEF